MQLQSRLEDFSAAKATIWSITPDADLERVQSFRAKDGIEIPILIDEDLATTAAYGILTDDGKLPHPTAIILAPDGKVTYVRVDEDYSQRPSPDELLAALKASATDPG